jgi:hypothetical protein
MPSSFTANVKKLPDYNSHLWLIRKKHLNIKEEMGAIFSQLRAER